MKKLEDIRNDHVSGASEIAIRCAEYLKSQASHITADKPNQFLSKLAQIGAQLKQAQPAMAPVYNAVHFVLSAVRERLGKGATTSQLRNAATEAAQNFTDRLKYSMKDLAAVGVSLIENQHKIMTYSSSRAVAALLKRAKTEGRSFTVVVPESRPMCEGRVLAQDLGSTGISCTVIVDGAISSFIDQVDVVLVGADRVSERCVVNKIGTRGLAIIAREFRVPIYCVCETSKFLTSDLLPFTQKENPAEQVWEKTTENVKVRNIYFEEVPSDSFTGFITEKGVLGPADVRRAVTEGLP